MNMKMSPTKPITSHGRSHWFKSSIAHSFFFNKLRESDH